MAVHYLLAGRQLGAAATASRRLMS
jgi:hypothetical protein